MKRFVWVLGLLVLAPFVAQADAPGAEPTTGDDRILGLWATDKGAAHVEIYREQGVYHGRIVWLAEPLYPAGDVEAGQLKHDRNNPDPDRHAEPILGLQIMQGFHVVGAGRWQDGTIYDPDNGKTYACKLWLTDDGTLKVRGYMGISLFGRTTEWLPVVGANVQPADTAAHSGPTPERPAEN